MSDTDLAAAAQIPLVILRAIKIIESGGNARAVRFEPHVFNRLTENRFAAQTPTTHNRAAFERAATLDETAAIKSTSWGGYQVLGRPLIERYPANPVAAFDAAPERVGDELVLSWFRSNPRGAAAARAGNIHELARRYNGRRSSVAEPSPWATRFRATIDSGRAGPWDLTVPEQPSASSIYIIGDSHTTVLGPKLRDKLTAKGWRVGFTAHGGWSTSRFVRDENLGTLVGRSDVVLVILGGNDSASSESAYARILDSALAELAPSGARIVWAGPAFSTKASVHARHEQHAEWQKRLLPARGVAWIDSRPMTRSGHSRDGVHFTQVGYDRWANGIVSVAFGVKASILETLTPFGLLLTRLFK